MQEGKEEKEEKKEKRSSKNQICVLPNRVCRELTR